MEEPCSPKKRKTEGRPDPPSASSSALINPASGEEKLAADAIEEEEDEELPGKYSDELAAYSWTNMDPETPLWLVNSDDDTEEEREITRRETTMLAKEALDSYNKKNKGVKFLFDEPRRSRNTLYHLAIVAHFNFTAREENNPSSSPHRFFAETLRYYRGPLNVLNCVDLESFAPGKYSDSSIYIYIYIYMVPSSVPRVKSGVSHILNMKTLSRP
ncbi:unnamed protein product [Linum trigynum]|uniref:DUF3615 domain-containing protein n=1 Tax=Linum trigynum TaxID=586398 RepID=A0AAV2C9D6_9ROSI